MMDSLERVIRRVVSNDNCTGCGGCTLISDRVSMQLSEEGWMRPIVERGDRASARREAAEFRAMCPGVRLDAPEPQSATSHPTFGRYLSAWRAEATDQEIRRAGSSAGVLTALATHLLDSGEATNVLGAAADDRAPRRTIPVSIMSREEALAASGSRYAPVSVLAGLDEGTHAVVAKPCEISALARRARAAQTTMPVALSFFCAGTPSQWATDRLVRQLDMNPDAVTSLRYRGDGWPGEFTVTDGERRAAVTYDDSWGKHLGRDLQWRCKICPDGTGEDADISVGDFWKADARGYPLFDNADGESVVIARTRRGHDLLLAAARLGVITLDPVDLDEVDRIQPLQRARKQTLAVRVFARVLTLKKVPRFRGYGAGRRAVQHPTLAARTFAGTLVRSWRDRTRGRRT